MQPRDLDPSPLVWVGPNFSMQIEVRSEQKIQKNHVDYPANVRKIDFDSRTENIHHIDINSYNKYIDLNSYNRYIDLNSYEQTKTTK